MNCLPSKCHHSCTTHTLLVDNLKVIIGLELLYEHELKNFLCQLQEARQLKKTAGGAAAAADAIAAAVGRHQVDIDSLAFSEGGHLMSNRDCNLPKNSYRSAFKGYEEVHVPALKPKPFGKDEQLKQIADLPDWAQPAFR